MRQNLTHFLMYAFISPIVCATLKRPVMVAPSGKRILIFVIGCDSSKPNIAIALKICQKKKIQIKSSSKCIAKKNVFFFISKRIENELIEWTHFCSFSLSSFLFVPVFVSGACGLFNLNRKNVDYYHLNVRS